VQQDFPYDQAVALVDHAPTPLGETYLAKWRRATAPGSGWIDVFPNEGKWAGNYQMAIAGDTHPLVLLNYRGDYRSMILFAHETGHAMHTAFSGATQPVAKARPSGFVTEVASITNEALLTEHLIRNAQGDDERLAYLCRHVEQFLSKVFRMARYAELELAIHRTVAEQGGITADELDRITLRLLREYGGHDQGVMVVDDVWASEWAFIPHLYIGFALYKYATSFVAANAASRQILAANGGDNYVEKFLKQGTAQRPLELLRDIGADLSGDDAYTAAFAVMEARLDEIEQLLQKRRAASARESAQKR